MPLPKLNNLLVSESCLRFCAIDLQMSFLASAIASKKIFKTISETCAKWLQFGAVSENWGLAFIITSIITVQLETQGMCLYSLLQLT